MIQEDKAMYIGIIKKALLILSGCMGITFMVTKNVLDVLSVAIGGGLSIGGFFWIIDSVYQMDLENGQNKKMQWSMLRFLIYFVVMYVCAKWGCSLVCMAIGFTSLSLGIKVNELFAFWKKRGD